MISYKEWINVLNEDMIPTPEMKANFSKAALNAVGKLLYKNYYDPNKCEFVKMGRPRQTIEGKKQEKGIIVLKANYPKTKDKEELERQKETTYFAVLIEHKYSQPKLFNITSGNAVLIGDTKEFKLMFSDKVKFLGFFSPIMRLSGGTKEQRDNAAKADLERRLERGDTNVMTLKQRLEKYKKDKRLSEIRENLIRDYGADIDVVIADMSKFDINTYIKYGTNGNLLNVIKSKISGLTNSMKLQDKLNFVRLFFGNPNMTNAEIKAKVNENPGYGVLLDIIDI